MKNPSHSFDRNAERDDHTTMMNWWYGYGSGFWGFGMIMMVLWWALIAVAIVALIRWIRSGAGEGTGGHDGGRGSALDILKERYAKGEITKEELEEMKKDVQ